jgi:hypothetical protein
MGGLIGIGLFLAGIAGVMAFLIAYDETSRHFPSRSQARRHALTTAITAFVFFAALTAVLAILVPHVIKP